MRFDGDSPLPFQIHGVKELIFHLPLAHSISALHQSITQSGFPVIDMGNNAEIPDF